MSFATWVYPFFLLAAAALFWALPARWRTPFIVAASFVFYSWWDVRFVAMLIAAAVLDYTCSNWIAGRRPARLETALLALTPLVWLLLANLAKPVPIAALTSAAAGAPIYWAACELGGRLREATRRRYFLVLAIAGSLALLGFFKYAGWFAENLEAALEAIGVVADWPALNILLPIGISFHIFQSISYVVDVYQGRVSAERSFLRILNMLCFFPQLVAGPIERAAHMLPQLHFGRRFDWRDVAWGCHLILVGYFLKVYVADSCGVVADYYFNSIGENPFAADWTLTGLFAFAFQIYGDFAGYSLIARGSALFFGVRLFRNFQLPYLALTPSDFWRRWHISLSSWFRDYVYLPLGGNRGTRGVVARNLMVTMMLAGIWHGASWRFALWGALHGGALIAWRAGLPGTGTLERARLPMKVLFWALTAAVVLAGWAVFRAASLEDVHAMLAALSHWHSAGVPPVWGSVKWILLHVLPWIALLAIVRRDGEEADIARLPWWALAPLYWLLATLVLSAGTQRPEFIYFQF